MSHPSMSPYVPTGDLLNLLHALPSPVAVFNAADGDLLAANEHFCKVLALPGEESAQIMRKGFGDTENGQISVRLSIINENIAHFMSPSGTRSLVDADIKTIQLSGKACWLIVPSAETWQNTPEQGDYATGHYRALLENLNEIIYANDKNANVAYISPNINRLSGYEAHEVIGKNFTEFVHPDDLEGRIEIFLKILSGEEQATEYRMITKTGEVKWARTNARPILRDGEVVGIQGALVDITDRKEVEEALRLSEEKYRNVVQNSKDAIFVAQDNCLKFMNPSAAAILGYTCESIADRPFLEFVHPDDREMITDRHRRRLAGESLSDSIIFRIINRSGDSKDVELNAVLITWEGKPAVLNFLRDITVQKKMESQLSNSQKADQGQIEQVLLNLLLNAADAMPDGGDMFIETARLKGARAEGKVTLSKSMEYIMVKVSDSGIGISKKILDRIFEPFFTTKGLGRGTGLGLSTAYGIVKNHDGDICVESEVGKGSTFFIYLPAFLADGTTPAATLESPKIACHGSILLVDDEPNVLHPSATLLERSGFTVFKALSGSIAMEMFQKNWENIDLVILDLILPNVSGKDLYYRFKEINPQVKVLISSGNGQSGQIEELIANGCSGFIQKPYNITELSTMMMEIISAECRQR